MSSASSRSQVRKCKSVAALCVLELIEDEDNKTERHERNWITVCKAWVYFTCRQRNNVSEEFGANIEDSAHARALQC